MIALTRSGTFFLRAFSSGNSEGQRPEESVSPAYRRPADQTDKPRSDVGTIVLHWSLAVAIVASLLTGLRLSADAEHSVFAKSLEAMLPQGEIWTWHFVSALVVICGIFAYGTYMSMARLKRRVSPKKTVVLTLPASPKLRWAAFNVLLYWALFASVIALTATGVLLYLGHGGVVVDIHYISALFVAGYIIVHVFGHYMYGGLAQLMRLFRPQSLRSYPGMIAQPFAKALAIGLVIAAATTYADFGTRDVLAVKTVSNMPALDGSLEDRAWKSAEPVFVRTQQGSNLDSRGESTVEVRAVRTKDQIAFAFRWQDSTRSLKRHPLIKKEDGWHMLNNRADIADETDFYEDKFAVMFSESNAFGSGASTHMGPKPLARLPGARNKRGLHYTVDGSLIDVWQWKASRGGMLGAVDDMWFGPPREAGAQQRAGKARYSGGYAADEGRPLYVYNHKKKVQNGYQGLVGVKRLPVDYRTTVSKLGNFELSNEVSDPAGSQWWMFEHETVPYSAEHDATIPVGTVIPGVLIMGEYKGSRADLRGGARWRDGYWTLEIVRNIRTGNRQDLDMTTGLYMWLAVFDHNQTRHTRHVRPVRLDLR